MSGAEETLASPPERPEGPSEHPASTDWIARIPKIDLHCHLIGTVRGSTFAELAHREGMELPDTPEHIWRDINSLPPDPDLYRNTKIPVPQGSAPGEPEVSYSLFQTSNWVKDVLRSADDLTRIVYEAFEDAHELSNTVHLELFFDDVPEHLTHLGLAGSMEAYAEGIRQAEHDFGMTGRMIKGIDRSCSGQHALDQVRQVVDTPHEYLAGIGLDNLETAGPPERFEDAYRLAGQAGLGRTAHASEHVPSADNTLTCLDVLGCDRIDHGYYVLEDERVIDDVRQRGTVFTVGSTTSRRSWRPWRRASIRGMLEAGLSVIPCSDDPGMFPTSLAQEYQIMTKLNGASQDALAAMTLRAVDACWLPDKQRARLRARVEQDLLSISNNQ
ncbi:MAG: adenosine deaminase family protein [Mycobacteriaceae bacterium]|uniref:adenosine deaminase family protein n=1 Tax=Corynebacterium sp. TaxID=1720 RepID=UPI003F97FDF1